MSALTTFQADIKNILEQARRKARSAVNTAMVEAYWLIGQRIVEEQHGQHKAEYGARLIEDLSTALMTDFGKGFSYANLYNCRQFYLTFPDQAILYTACRDLSWSCLRLIMRDSPQAIADDLCGAMSASYAVNKALHALKHYVTNLKLNSYLNLTKV